MEILDWFLADALLLLSYNHVYHIDFKNSMCYIHHAARMRRQSRGRYGNG